MDTYSIISQLQMVSIGLVIVAGYSSTYELVIKFSG